MARTPEQAAKIAEMRKQVFAKQLSFTEFAFQVSLIDGKCQDREDYDAQIREEGKREREFHEKVSHLL